MSEPIRVLLVVSEPANVARISELLARADSAYQLPLACADDYEQALAAIRRREHDVCVVAYSVGGRPGLDLIQQALREGAANPLILLTPTPGPYLESQAAQVGAAYYLDESGLDPPQLERAIRFCLHQSRRGGHLWQLNQHVDAHVQQRTWALRESEHFHQETITATRQALAKERELHEMKSRFVTMASHEFRTPLSTILSAADLLGRYQGAQEGEKRARNVARIQEAVADLTAILDDFLDINRLDANQIPVSPVSVDLLPFVAQVVTDLQPTLRPGQRIGYEATGPAEPVWLDPYMLRHILLNLLTNASKYSADHSPIWLTTEVRETALTLHVRDEGMGIPEEDKPHLFSDFFRARNAVHLPGTGLGLYIVRRYVELLGGWVDFTSELERGTTFTVHIPRSQMPL